MCKCWGCTNGHTQVSSNHQAMYARQDSEWVGEKQYNKSNVCVSGTLRAQQGGLCASILSVPRCSASSRSDSWMAAYLHSHKKFQKESWRVQGSRKVGDVRNAFAQHLERFLGGQIQILRAHQLPVRLHTHTHKSHNDWLIPWSEVIFPVALLWAEPNALKQSTYEISMWTLSSWWKTTLHFRTGE